MKVTFGKDVRYIFEYSREEAIRLGHESIAPEHFILGILRERECMACQIIKNFIKNIDELRKLIEKHLPKGTNFNQNPDFLIIQNDTKTILDIATVEAINNANTEVHSEHLLIGIIRVKNTFISELLTQKYRITNDSINEFLGEQITKEEKINLNSLKEPRFIIAGEENNNESEDDDISEEIFDDLVERDGASLLESYGVDYTEKAKKGEIEKIIGREREITRIIQILSKKKKNNPIIIGEPGVGKTAIVEAIAQKIANNDVPPALIDSKLIALELSVLVAGTKYRGQFEDRVNKLINEVKEDPSIILFIDEIHNLVGAGNPPGGLDAANILKPSLAKGEIKCIGTTTIDEYREYFEPDAALERRFEKVYVEPTNEEETLDILENVKTIYEKFHNVKYTDAAIKACIHLSQRYITDKNLPDKAINLLDESGAQKSSFRKKESQKLKKLKDKLDNYNEFKEQAVKKKDYELALDFRSKIRDLEKKIESEKSAKSNINPIEIDSNIVEKTVSVITGIPIENLAKNEIVKLLNMNQDLKKQIIGQDEAIDKVVQAIKRNRSGLRDPDKPIASFIFLGPTGVGKTQLAKSLSEQLFESDNSLIRIDMSEYMEKYSVSRLIGASPGYVGYEEGGQLTEKVKHNPYSVVLFDEIEKAHPDIYNLLLQILDDGIITDSRGKTIDMKNAVIIMTSNIGIKKMSEFGKGLGFETAIDFDENKNAQNIIGKELKRIFSPEFLNRIDEVIYFKSLGKEEITKIIDLRIEDLNERIDKYDMKFKFSTAAKNFLLEKSFIKEYGARPVQRTIQKYIEDEITDLILSGQINQSVILKFDKEEGKDKLTVRVIESNV